MKKIIISFGGKPVGNNRHLTMLGIHRDYSAEVKRLFKSAEPFGFDGYWEYNNDWLKNSAYWQTDAKKVLTEPSFGWAFKPICIYDALSMVDDGDVVVWVDSNDMLIAPVDKMINFATTYGIYCHDHFPTYYLCENWTQKDMFVRMGCDEEKYWKAPQIQVNIMAFCKNERTMAIAEEWVRHAIDYETIIQNVLPNHNGFKEHRHEQSIFSLLVVKHNLFCARGYPYEIAKEEDGINI
jgi:hypothetical protein